MQVFVAAGYHNILLQFIVSPSWLFLASLLQIGDIGPIRVDFLRLYVVFHVEEIPAVIADFFFFFSGYIAVHQLFGAYRDSKLKGWRGFS